LFSLELKTCGEYKKAEIFTKYSFLLLYCVCCILCTKAKVFNFQLRFLLKMHQKKRFIPYHSM
jgi:hypothetical protein